MTTELLPGNWMTEQELRDYLHDHRNDYFVAVDLKHNEELSEIIFSTDLHLHLPEHEVAQARLHLPSTISSLDDPLIDGINRGIATVGKKYTPGILPPHTVEVIIKKEIYKVELPEVEVWKNNGSYVTRVSGSSKQDVELETLKCLNYCYRYGMSTGPVAAAALRKGMKYDKYEKLAARAKRYAPNVKTIDVPLVEWFTRAVEYCNTMQQVDILVWIYKEAATYTTMQPVICKSRIAEQLGCSRKSVMNLVQKLEKNHVLEQGPESMKKYDFEAGKPMSNPRILNLDLTQPGRWWMMDLEPGPDRSIEKKTMKQRKTDVLKANGYWK